MLANPVTTIDMDFEKRLNMGWFSRRSERHTRIKNFLIGKIYEHQPELNIAYPLEDLRDLPYEDLLELAIGCVNKELDITLGHGSDFSDKSDAKFTTSVCRNNHISKGLWTHSFAIPGTGHKEGLIRICGYNTIDDNFYFFCIPANKISGRLEIVIHYEGGVFEEPDFNFPPQKHRKWWDYECASFEEMATRKTPPNKVNKLFQII